MTPDDFALTAVPLRGPLAPIAALLGDGDNVYVDAGDGEGWWGQVVMDADTLTRVGWVWVDSATGWPCVRVESLSTVNLTTSPAARAATVAWLEEQGYTAAYRSDDALLIALRHVCGLPAVVPPVDCDDDPIPF